MPAYRFCRPDDIPLLVAAVNECYDVHYPDRPPLTLDKFREEMKEIDLWPSNCMVAMAGDDPIAVLIGTKRTDEAFLLRLGVRSDYQRQGHGLHLLTSLSQKLSVLGPPRLIAEVPHDEPGVLELAAAAGYEAEVTFTDYLRPANAPAIDEVPAELVLPATVDDLIDAELLTGLDSRPGGGVAWERTAPVLQARAGVLQGWAIGTPMGLDAYLLAHLDGDDARVVGFGARDQAWSEALPGLLLRSLISTTKGSVRLSRLVDGELPADLLRELGFEAVGRFTRYGREATPA